MVTQEEKDRLLRKYWTISERQIEASVVLAVSCNPEHSEEAKRQSGFIRM